MNATTTRSFLAAVVAVAALLAAPGAEPQAAGGGFDELARELARIADGVPGGGRAGVAVADVLSGTEIFARSGDEQLNPASNPSSASRPPSTGAPTGPRSAGRST